MTGTDLRTGLRVHVRWMIRRDLSDVLDIDHASFAYSWSEEDFLTALRQRNCIGMVAERGDRVVGYKIYQLYRNRIELLRLAVAPDVRRCGVGGQLVNKLAGKLSPDRRTQIDLVVRETNLGGQLFLKAQGFLATGVNRGHFEDAGDDGYAMSYGLEGNPGPPRGG